MLIAGIDEVGRGCIAGPVFAAVVILDPAHPITGLTDSKKLTPAKRDALAPIIKAKALAWAIGRAEASEIDRINILQASLLAMQRAYASLRIKPDTVLVDGIHFPTIPCSGSTVVQGDLSVAEISAASIIAKVARDQEMMFLDRLYPDYELAKHKGYPTQLHVRKLQQFGVSPLHRQSFAPVKKAFSA